jgi:glycerophosphoryl diester phosphodiesterase
MDKIQFKLLVVALSFLLLLPASIMADQDQDIGTPRWVIDDVLTSDIVPFAIGHRGYGVNTGEIPDKPVENTTKSVRRAFREGVQIVEVDANLTADGVAVALHNDYLIDLTCINTLTFEALKGILPEVSSLRQILKVSRTYSVMSDSDRPSGQVVVEIKTPTPFCVPLEEELFVLEALVDAVLEDIRFTRMADQVTIESFSPDILALAAAGEPDIPRMLALDALQLLPPEWIEANTEYLVKPIGKDSFGLPWGEIGIEPAPGYPVIWFYRLPGYYPQTPEENALGNYIMTLGGTWSSIASIDKNVLFMAGSSAPDVVETFHYYGLSVLIFTIDDQFQWQFVSMAGVDGVYVDDIPMGLIMEGQ